jgi:hypothetical protein
MGLIKNINIILKNNIMKQVNQQLLSNFTGTFHMLTNELSKPQEDVVAVSVCGSTRYAIENILKLYLDSYGVESKNAKNINDLVILCVGQNKHFLEYDFAKLNCHCEPVSTNTMVYCLGEDKLTSCYNLLVDLKKFIFNELKISEIN